MHGRDACMLACKHTHAHQRHSVQCLAFTRPRTAANLSGHPHSAGPCPSERGLCARPCCCEHSPSSMRMHPLVQQGMPYDAVQVRREGGQAAHHHQPSRPTIARPLLAPAAYRRILAAYYIYTQVLSNTLQPAGQIEGVRMEGCAHLWKCEQLLCSVQSWRLS